MLPRYDSLAGGGGGAHFLPLVKDNLLQDAELPVPGYERAIPAVILKVAEDVAQWARIG